MPGLARNFLVLFILLLVGMRSTLAFAQPREDLTNLACGADQTLWIYELGDRGALTLPDAMNGGQWLPNAELWVDSVDGGADLWVADFSNLPQEITSGAIYERVSPSQGIGSVQLGNFVNRWPMHHSPYVEDGAAYLSSAASSQEFKRTLDLAGFRYQDHNPSLSEDVLTYLRSSSFDGSLTYYIESPTQLEYLRLALCSDVAAPEVELPPVVSGETDTDRTTLLEEALVEASRQKLVEQARRTQLEKDIQALTASLAAQSQELEQLRNATTPNSVASELDRLQREIDRLKANQGSGVWPYLAGLLGLANLGLLVVLIKRGGKAAAQTIVQSKVAEIVEKAADLRPKLERPEDKGLVFAGSVMVPGSVPTGGVGGQLAAGQLGNLSGVYAPVRRAYHATGRIGYPQIGVPTNEDVAMGTGFLISPNHVLTNRHVYEMYLEDIKQGGGIEFWAEKDEDKSEFHAFTEDDPIFLPGLDVAIFRLAKSVRKRKPISLNVFDVNGIQDREIVVIGYPCPRNVTDKIAAVVEENPIFAVKRLSEGHIFRHSSDQDDPLGVSVPVSDIIHQDEEMTALCHNASTTGGSSGSPVLDKQSGDLLGVHFGFDVAFDWAEAANFAMAVPMIEAAVALDDLKHKLA